MPRIRGAMLDELRTMDWVPRLVRSKASKLEAARKQLEAETGRPPSDNELAQQLNLPMDEYEKMRDEASAVNLVSLNKKWYETDSYKDVREIDIIEDTKGEDPTRGIQKRDLMRLVTKGLNRNERLIIILYYYEVLTMRRSARPSGSPSPASARCTPASSRGSKTSSASGGRSSRERKGSTEGNAGNKGGPRMTGPSFAGFGVDWGCRADVRFVGRSRYCRRPGLRDQFTGQFVNVT